ncbi:MAG: hypothetical protein IPJ75_01705 [Ignavibacteriales bacterium]|nr:hypothetical protein [Ignavibacteriales bacterium]
MKIHELFAQDITRRIEGVVKVADETNLLNEMREFVITEEIQKVLLKFFGRYTEDKPVNPGVWLSGFFGTGKSHLLKILSLLLSNKEVEGIRLGDYFKEKTLNEVNDFELEGYINMSLRVPTQTILFNIDSVVDNAYREGDKNILMPFKRCLTVPLVTPTTHLLQSLKET